jgi:hypothetical protein
MPRHLPGRFHPRYLFRDKNRCDTGKTQSKWTAKDGNAWRTNANSRPTGWSPKSQLR